MSFLSAEWRKLVLVNYTIDPNVLSNYVPFGTELDLWNNKCYVSLVGFMFVNTKLLGIKIPFHVNFEEVNLRFYVKRYDQGKWKRGVVFIKEIVSKPALTFVANTIYHENYQTMPMRHEWSENDQYRTVKYDWKYQNKWHTIKVEAEIEPSNIKEGSETEFITEHYWGYAKINDKRTNEYEVTHPKWEAYDILNYEIDVDYGVLYGEIFSFLNRQNPESVMLAEGSEITVEHAGKIH